MVLYLVASLFFLVAIVMLFIAPRNLIDNILFIIGFIILFFAVLNDPSINNLAILQEAFYWLERGVRLIAPLLSLIFGFWMLPYAIKIYQVEKSKLQLTIGISLALLLLGGTVFQYVMTFVLDSFYYRDFIRIFQFAMAYFVLSFINYLVLTLRLTLLEDESKQDFVVVLGEKLTKDGAPSKVLENRLEMAVSYLNRQQFNYHHMPLVIVSGADTATDSDVSEARKMADYLINQGIPEEYILIEDQARNTHENFIYAKELMQAHSRHLETSKAVFVTSSYHLYRSQLYANMENLYQMSGVGAQTSFSERVINWVREFVAIIFMHRKLHLAISLLMIALGVINYVHF